MLPGSSRHALLLQGPNGPFFARLGRLLRARGARVTKVNFHPGDSLFYRGPDVIHWRRPMSEWPAFVRDLIRREGIDAVYLFGDCRPMHRAAVAACRELEVPVHVFEEGYLRPDYITCERGGVNGNSSLPRDPDFYRRAAAALPELPPIESVGPSFFTFAVWTILNAWAVTLFGWRYPHYRHHRDVNAVRQGVLWVRGFFRKLWYKNREEPLLDRLAGEWSGRYYFVPLQVHCDAQVSHSRFPSVDSFIEHVVAAFAAHAPEDTLLCLKHHPHDRAYRDYTRLLRRLEQQHGLDGRIVYVHDLHLPTILRHARGTIAMNSTVGLSSLYHDTPVICLGTAIYDLPGLTYQGELPDFFRNPGTIDRALMDAFVHYLRATNQINGSFYKRLPGRTATAGLHLPEPAPHEREDRWTSPLEESA